MGVVRIAAERVLPYRAEDLFTLVADVRAYPSFIPWVRQLGLRDERLDGARWSVRADVTIGWRTLTESFTTDVVTDRAALTVEAALVEGPFRHLHNVWRFAPMEKQGGPGGRVQCLLDYEFKNPLLQMLASANRDLAAGRIMAAFEREADKRFAVRA